MPSTKKKRKTRVATRKLAAKIESLIGKNYTDTQICAKLQIHANVLTYYKKRIYRKYQAMFENLDNAAVYADYLMKSRIMVSELNSVKTMFRKNGQWSSLVSAVKCKKDIYDSCIKMGQEFGFIEQKATELKMSGELEFSGMSNTEIRHEIEREVKELHKLAEGTVVNMRPEILEQADGSTQKFLPSYVETPRDITPKRKPRKMKVKTKITLSKKRA